MKVYIVTTGEYSDYSFHSVWSQREKAEEVEKLLSHDRDTSILEMELDSFPTETLVPGYFVWISLANGIPTTPPSPRILTTPYQTQIYPSRVVKDDSVLPKLVMDSDEYYHAADVNKSYRRKICICAFDRTPEIATKKALDYRAKVLAQIEGI